MFQTNGSLFSGLTLLCLPVYQLKFIRGLCSRNKRILFCFAQSAYFPFRLCRVQQVRSAYFFQHRGQRQVTLRSALSAVLNRNPQ